MAAERANQEGLPCALVVVADDCALPRTKGITGARGVAGTVLVHKIAGAAAGLGKSLHDVRTVAMHAASRMGTLGIALDSVTVPGASEINNRLDESTIEIGLGIHGEAGMKKSKLLTANEMAAEMVSTMQSHGRVVSKKDGVEEVVPLFEKGDEICILVNNLGGTSNFEMSILARSCVNLLESDEYCAKVTRVFVGAYMTSFDMHGASLTILNVQGEPGLIELLDSPTDAPAWMKCDVWKSGDARPSATEVPEVVVDEQSAALKQPLLKIEGFEQLSKSLISASAKKLEASEAMLTKYDTIVGDGDCGLTMKRGAEEVLKRLEDGTIPTNHPVPMFAALADAVSSSMGGTSGVLLELMFLKFGSTLSHAETIGIGELSCAFEAGVEAVSLYGGAKVGSRTMLDALVPAAQAFALSMDIKDAASKAREGADGTAKMKAASAGRSNYLSQAQLEGTPDPGAIAVALVLEELAK